MTWHLESVLPPPLLARLTAFGPRLGQSDREAENVLMELSRLPPSLVVHACYEISVACQIYRAARDAASDHALLRRSPVYAWLFLFHAAGQMREAALDAIRTPPPSPFLFAALVWRLSDWVGPASRAAQRCVERVITRTAPEIASAAAVYLLEQRLAWRQSRDEAKGLDSGLERMFERAEVMASISAHLAQQATGPMPGHLRYILRYPSFDPHLTELALSAVQPVVRAMAYRCLISGEASWSEPDPRSKMDKLLGMKRWTPKFETRAIQPQRATLDVIADGVRDRSALVRKTVADALIAARPRLRDHEALILDVIDLLKNDRSAAVRSRADFMRRHPPGT